MCVGPHGRWTNYHLKSESGTILVAVLGDGVMIVQDPCHEKEANLKEIVSLICKRYCVLLHQHFVSMKCFIPRLLLMLPFLIVKKSNNLVFAARPTLAVGAVGAVGEGRPLRQGDNFLASILCRYFSLSLAALLPSHRPRCCPFCSVVFPIAFLTVLLACFAIARLYQYL